MKHTVSTLSGKLENGAPVFKSPQGIVLDPDGNIYVADQDGSMIKQISKQGVSSPFAGTGSAGYEDGPADKARFNNPQGLAMGSNGNIYVADRRSHRIRMITPEGIVSNLAGSGKRGFADGAKDEAMFDNPCGLTLDKANNVYVTDKHNHRIRKITPEGEVSTIAGSQVSGYRDGHGDRALFHFPRGITIDKEGNLYVSDMQNHRIRIVSKNGVVGTWAGCGIKGLEEGPRKLAQFGNPKGIVSDGEGNLYVCDSWNCRIRKISSEGMVETVAGSGYFGGWEDGEATQAKFRNPSEIAIDAEGNLYISDEGNRCIRKIV